MIKVMPFNNPFKKIEKFGDKVVETITKSGKTYRKITKSDNKQH